MKYCPEIVEDICKHIRSGVPNRDTAMIVGIHEDTFYEWMKSRPEFSERVKKAYADRTAELVAQIDTDKSWQSKAWMLERTRRKDFGRYETVEHSGEVKHVLTRGDALKLLQDEKRDTPQLTEGS